MIYVFAGFGILFAVSLWCAFLIAILHQADPIEHPDALNRAFATYVEWLADCETFPEADERRAMWIALGLPYD